MTRTKEESYCFIVCFASGRSKRDCSLSGLLASGWFCRSSPCRRTGIRMILKDVRVRHESLIQTLTLSLGQLSPSPSSELVSPHFPRCHGYP
jgi:hypothetical protein